MDAEEGSPKPAPRSRRWNTAYDTYADGFTFREELNFEYDSESSSSDSEEESDPPVINLVSDDEEQETEKNGERETNVNNSADKKRRRRRRWSNVVRNLRTLQQWRIRSMDAIFLQPCGKEQANGSKCSYPAQIQEANIEVEDISDLCVIVDTEFAGINGATDNFVPPPQEPPTSNESTQRIANFAPPPQEPPTSNESTQRTANFVSPLQEPPTSNESTRREPTFVVTLPPIDEFFAARSSAAMSMPPPNLQNTSSSEIAALPPPPIQARSFRSTSEMSAMPPSQVQNMSAARFPVNPRPSLRQNSYGSSVSEVGVVYPSPMQDRSYRNVAEFAMEAPSMMQNTFGPRAYGSFPRPSPFLEDAGGLGQAMEAPSMPQNVYEPRVPFFEPPPPPVMQNASNGEFAAEPSSWTQNVFRPRGFGSPTQVPYGVLPPGVSTGPGRFPSRPQRYMRNNFPPRRYRSRPQSSMRRNRFSYSRGYDDPRFVNGVPLPLNLPPPLIPITPELYPICNRIARRQREQRKLQLQKLFMNE